mmetsp:Transcript_9783/g.28113  ORF Transcript_9783/g.28113 Transcript_9783/m.28113 type:complete len:243 (-) Transcript_9783:69-797(-)
MAGFPSRDDRLHSFKIRTRGQFGDKCITRSSGQFCCEQNGGGLRVSIACAIGGQCCCELDGGGLRFGARAACAAGASHDAAPRRGRGGRRPRRAAFQPSAAHNACGRAQTRHGAPGRSPWRQRERPVRAHREPFGVHRANGGRAAVVGPDHGGAGGPLGGGRPGGPRALDGQRRGGVQVRAGAEHVRHPRRADRRCDQLRREPSPKTGSPKLPKTVGGHGAEGRGRKFFMTEPRGRAQRWVR